MPLSPIGTYQRIPGTNIIDSARFVQSHNNQIIQTCDLITYTLLKAHLFIAHGKVGGVLGKRRRCRRVTNMAGAKHHSE